MNRKSIITLCMAVALGTSAASAQYLCQEKGTQLIYTDTTLEGDDKGKTNEYVTTVISVETDAAGLVTNRIEEVHKVPGNEFAEIKNYTGYTYNPATGLTVDRILTADDFKHMIVNTLVDAAKMQGQSPSESDIKQLEDMIKAKGELFIELPAEPDQTAKIPNRSIKLSVATESMSMNLWETKYLGFEDVEVPAGKFEKCFKVSYVVKETNSQSTEKKYITEWFAKGIGSVKTVETDKKGKPLSETVLSSIKK